MQLQQWRISTRHPAYTHSNDVKVGVIKPVLQHAETSGRQQPVVDLSNALYTAQLITGNMTRGNYSAVLVVRK
jgi:hypothetical protein